MRLLLHEPDYRQVMCNCVAVLNPKFRYSVKSMKCHCDQFCYCRLGDMKVPECKFYDSKMRPLLLVYENPDPHSVTKDVRIMFKHGDG